MVATCNVTVTFEGILHTSAGHLFKNDYYTLYSLPTGLIVS